MSGDYGECTITASIYLYTSPARQDAVLQACAAPSSTEVPVKTTWLSGMLLAVRGWEAGARGMVDSAAVLARWQPNGSLHNRRVG